jgi:hypothetical protein
MKDILERAILIIRHVDGPIAKNLIKDIEEVLATPEQQKRKPLSDDEITNIANKNTNNYGLCQYFDFARAIEKAHGIGE